MHSVARLLAGTMLSASLIAPAVAQNEPAETQAPNAPDQAPAFEGQTRAPQPDTPVAWAEELVAENLPQLWAMEFLPDGRMLVTAKAGAMHIISTEGVATAVTGNLPEVDRDGQGGLLDVALAPDFAESGRIYFSYAEPRDDGNGTTFASATLVLDGEGGSLENIAVLFRQEPTYDGDKHFGSRVVPLPDGTLFLTVGERSDEPIRDQAQELASALGKVFHLDSEGQPVPDNPFVETQGALPEIWSLGHRNVQSATLDGEGRLWIVEHGAKGGTSSTARRQGSTTGGPR